MKRRAVALIYAVVAGCQAPADLHQGFGSCGAGRCQAELRICVPEHCKTLSEIRQGSIPALQESSAKSFDRLAICIGDKIDSLSLSFEAKQYTALSTAGGYSILIPGEAMGRFLLVDVARRSAGATATVYSPFVTGSGQVYIDAVKDCL